MAAPAVLAEPIGPEVRVVRIPQAGQVVKAQRSGDRMIHVVFDASDGPRYARSSDGGLTFGESVAVLDEASERSGLHWFAADLAVGGGYVHVALANDAWKLKLPQEEWGLYYARLAPGRSTFSPVRNLNRTPSEGFSLAADDEGHVSASFLSGRLFTMTSRDFGEHFSAMAEFDSAWDPCDCCTTSLSFGTDGRLAVLYREQTGDDRDMYLGLVGLEPDSGRVRSRISTTGWHVEACPMTYFSIQSTPGGYLAAWPTQGVIYFARINQDGHLLDPGEIRTPGKIGMRMGLLVLGSLHETLVAWKDQGRLEWLRFTSDGRPSGSPSSVTSEGNWAAGVAVAEGRFVLFR